MVKKIIMKVSSKLPQCYVFTMLFVLIFTLTHGSAFASSDIPVASAAVSKDIWATGRAVIIDLYNQIVGLSTVLAALMSAIAVIGAKMSNNQHKVDQAWDWCATRS